MRQRKEKLFISFCLFFFFFFSLLPPLYSCWLHFFILLLVVLFTFELSKSSIIIIKLVLVFVAQLFEFSDTNMESNLFAIVSSTMNCLRFEQKYARSEVFGALTWVENWNVQELRPDCSWHHLMHHIVINHRHHRLDPWKADFVMFDFHTQRLKEK